MANNPLSNQYAPEPELMDAFNAMKKDFFLAFNCHALATIQSFDAGTQKIQATINYKKTYITGDPLTGLPTPVLKDYPLLIDIPLVQIFGGNAALTMPIAKGDTCLILFNDRDIDIWITSGQIAAPQSSRLHSFSDAIALIGVRPFSNPITDYDSARAVLRNGDASIGVGAEKIQIKNGSQNLNSLLQTLISNVQELVTACSAITVLCSSPGVASGPPVNVTAIEKAGTDLSDTASKIGELLE